MKQKFDWEYALSLPPNGTVDFNEYVDAAFQNYEISEEELYEINKVYFTKCYLSHDNPRGQSGNGGDEFHYMYSHLPIIHAVTKNGTFCDIGCANGHLLEMVHKWVSGVGYNLQMFGVDISEGLIELAQRRLPHWRDNFFVGNAHFWKPEKKFDYIHTRGELVQFEEPSVEPKRKRTFDNRMLFEHYMKNYLVDSGRFIIGPYWYKNEDTVLKGLLSWGYSPTGYSEKTHYDNPNMLRKVIWVDKI